jgi:hypothetical protein
MKFTKILQDIKEAKDSFGMPSHSHDHVMKKIKDGHWEAQRDVVPGKHLEVRDTTTKNIKTIHVKPVKEETMTIDEQINEVLSKDATAGDWIHDFVHSDNPKFADKSKDKRKEMALAAYYAKQRNEEVELAEAINDNLHPAGAALLKHIKPEHQNKYKAHLTTDTFNGSYKDRTDVLNAAKKAGHLKEAKDEQEYGYEGDMALNQLKTLTRCAEMITDMLKPDTDLPEWVQSKITLATDYIQTAADYMYSELKEGVYSHDVERAFPNGKASGVKTHAPVAPVPDRKFIKGTPENLALKASRKPINGMPTNVKEGTMKSFREVIQSIQEANHREFASQGLMHPDMAKHMKTGQEMDFYHSKTGDKLSGIVKKNTDGQVHIQANKDGKMGGGDVHKFNISSKMNEALKGSQHKLDKNKNGKVDAHDFKILRGEDDIKEDVLDELSKSTLGSYAKKASRDAVITRKIGADFERKADAARSPGMQAANTELSSKYKQKSFKRRDGLEKAVDRLSKEEVETRTVSFSDFITQLNEYTPGKDGVTRIQGKSYGAQYRDPEGDDDAFDRKPKQVAKPEPEVKRGRGRPAGSKSGANQKVTSGTKRSGVDYSGYKLHLPNSNR